MHHGTRPTKKDRRDYDLIPSFGLVTPPKFKDEHSTDAGLWCPDQNEPNLVFGFPALPYGCTDYTQADLCTDERLTLTNPITLEAITHANASGGYSIRDSLDAARRLGWFSAYFTVTPHGTDFFDAIRLSVMSGYPEKRSVSVGTPWFTEWQGFRGEIMPMPKKISPYNQIWHNWKIAGWKTIDGLPYLIGKSWQGERVGDKGYQYFSREVINSVMSIDGTAAFTASNTKPADVKTINLAFWWQWVYNLIGYFY